MLTALVKHYPICQHLQSPILNMGNIRYARVQILASRLLLFHCENYKRISVYTTPKQSTDLAMEFCLKLFALLLLAALGSSQNLTLQDAASGSEVTLLSIGSVHQSGVFGDDKEMLRRIAYTETRDGTKSNTYRSGYHGGIWAVDEDNFLKTKNTTRYTRLPARFQQIRLHFGIDWQTVQWRELRKPLFSALAARLVLYIAPATIPSADNLTAQGEFWVAHYNSGGDASTFETTSSGLQGK